jgi:OOP family OmpA-OmpF porin
VIRNLLVSILMLFLTSCVNVEKIKKTRIEGNDFNAQLAKDYKAFVEQEAVLCDWRDAEHFAKKALMAASNQPTEPEQASFRKDIKGVERVELDEARSKLLVFLSEDNKKTLPNETSSAQFFYDCWVEEQEEGWQTENIKFCKDHHIAAMLQLENQLEEVSPSSYEQPIVDNSIGVDKSVEVASHIPTYTLHFDLNRYNIDLENYQILQQAVDTINSNGLSKVDVQGYADRTGTEEYNNWLSNKRAEVVADALVKLGVKRDSLYINSFGKHHLAVETAEGVVERLNRRVVKAFCLFISLMLVLGCTRLETLKRVESKGNDFQKALTNYYRDFAEKEEKLCDWNDSQHFIQKGMVAAYGKTPLPENLAYWNISPSKLPELTEAKKKLVELIYHKKLFNTQPELSAKAQFSFDCWVEEQEEGWQPDAIDGCRENFYQSIHELSKLVYVPNHKYKLSPEKKKTVTKNSKSNGNKVATKVKNKNNTSKDKNLAKAKNVSKSKSFRDIQKNYHLTLSEKSFAIRDNNKSTLVELANFLSTQQGYEINITAYCDKEENEAEKLKLAKLRAKSVKDLLKKHGIKEDSIVVYAFAEFNKNEAIISEGAKDPSSKVIDIIIGD